MNENTMKKLFAAFLSCALAGQPILINASQVTLSNTTLAESEELKIAFDQEYAQVGKELRVVVEGADDASCTYTWKRDGAVMSNKSNHYTPTSSDIETMIEVTVTDKNGKAKSASILVSKLPVIYIDTENNQPVTSKDSYINATMHIQGNELYNSSNGGTFDGEIEIKGRGNSTWGQPKKPYKLKLGEKTDLFQMGESKHWVLLANYTDTSLLRNTLAYDLSGEMGMYQMETIWVDVVFNGVKVGNYQFCEQIRIADDRIAITNWEDVSKDVAKAIAKKEDISKNDRDSLEDALNEDMEWVTTDKVTFQGKTYTVSKYYDVPDIDGGYLLEMDEYYDEISKFKTKHNQPINFKSPEFCYTNKEMMAYVSTYLQAFEDAVYNEHDFTAVYEGENKHYSELFDMNSLIDYWLIQELFFNEDGMKKSTYLYKDHDDLFHMGPIWDMDWAANGEGDTKRYDQWQTKYFQANAQKQQWYTQLIKDPYFLMRAQQRYWEIHDLLENMVKKDGKIDEYTTYLKESANINDKKWYGSDRFISNVQGLKTWMTNRIQWLDQQFATKDMLFASLGTYAEDEMRIRLLDEKENQLSSDNNVDGFLPASSDLELLISGTGDHAEVYVNGLKQADGAFKNGFAKLTVPFDCLNDTSIIEIRDVNQEGTVLASSMRTIKISNPVVYEMIISAPEKLVYAVGESLDLTGFKAELRYSDDHREDISDQVEMSGFSSVHTGTYTVNVTYQQYHQSFEVTVVADKTALAQLLEEVRSYEQKAYTQSTWENLQKAIIAATAVDENKDATQEAVDQTVKELQAAKNALVERGNIETLEEELNNIKKLDENAYTLTSWKNLTRVVQSVESLLNNQNITQAMVDSAFTSLTAARNALIARGNVEALQEELQNITKLDETAFTKTSWNHLMTVVQSVEGLLNDQNATQTMVDTALASLKDAKAALVKRGDKTVLKKTVDEAVSLDEGEYTKDSWNALQTAIEKAQIILENIDAEQYAIDEAARFLQEAVDHLAPVAIDRAVLNQTISMIKALNASDYTQNSWTTLMNALAQAENLLDKESATQEEVDDAVCQLMSAYEKLQNSLDQATIQKFTEYLEVVNKLQKAEYSNEDFAYIEQVAKRVQDMLNAGTYDEKEVAQLLLELKEADNRIQNHNKKDPVVPEKPSDQDNGKKEPQKENQTPDTGDHTSVATGWLGLLSAGCFAWIAAQKKRKTQK